MLRNVPQGLPLLQAGGGKGPRTGSGESRKLHNGSLLRPRDLGKESDF